MKHFLLMVGYIFCFVIFTSCSSYKTQKHISIAPEIYQVLNKGAFTTKSLSFSPNSTLLLNGSSNLFGPDGYLGLWNVKTGKLVSSTQLAAVQYSTFFNEGKEIIAALEGEKGIFEGQVYIMDASNYKIKSVLTGPIHRMRELAVSYDGKLIAGAGGEIRRGRPNPGVEKQGFVILWDNLTKKILWSNQSSRGNVNSISFSKDNILCSGDDKGLIIWDLRKWGQVYYTIKWGQVYY